MTLNVQQNGLHPVEYAMYNPYDLIELLINNQPMFGRPTEFDSEAVDQNTMRNAFGGLVKPSKISTVCPDCGQGLEISVNLGEPPFDTVAISCEHCHPAPPPIVDPFMNPIQAGRILAEDLDPIAHKYSKPFITDSAEPLDVEFDTSGIPKPPPKIVMPEIKPKNNKKKKKKIEPADGISEEMDEDGLV